jgi:membrane fusion protein (multidrug efflux system)
MISRRTVLGIIVLVALVAVAVVWRLGRGGGGEEEIIPSVAVHLGRVERATLRRTVTAYGTVEAEPALDSRPAGGALITPFVEGVVTGIEVVEGRRVREGELLFRLDSRMTEAAVERARARAGVAEEAFQRQERLLATDGTSQKVYLEARAERDGARADLAAAETELAYMNITAPLSGTVLHIDAAVGQHVTSGTLLAQVVDLDRLVVTAGVPAREMTGVQVGQRVLLGPGDSVPEGALRVVGKDVDPSTGTYRVQASIPAGSGLMPGQFTEIRIVAEEHAGVLAVPEESVVTRPEEGTWIVVVEGEQAVRLHVAPGLRDGGLVEVAGEGVEEGLSIVTEEAYGLPEETNIRVVEGG